MYPTSAWRTASRWGAASPAPPTSSQPRRHARRSWADEFVPDENEPTATARRPAAARMCLRPNVNVPAVLQFHDADDPTLRQGCSARRQLFERDAEVLHGVPACAEDHPLALERLETTAHVRVHAGRHERFEAGTEHDELERFDVLPPTDARDVIAYIAEDELGLVDAGVVQLVHDAVLPGALFEVRGLDDRPRRQGDEDEYDGRRRQH